MVGANSVLQIRGFWLDLNSNLFFRGFNNINSSHQLKTVKTVFESFGVVVGVREEAGERDDEVVGDELGRVGGDVEVAETSRSENIHIVRVVKP